MLRVRNISIYSFESRIFEECKSLIKIVIPIFVTKIRDHVFHKCTSLKEILVPSSVVLIEDNAFFKLYIIK